MNYNEKVKWLKEINESGIQMAFCDDLFNCVVNTEIEIYNYENNLLKELVNSVSNNLVIINFLNDLKLDFEFDDVIDYLEVKEMICFENIKRLCKKADNLYYKDRFKEEFTNKINKDDSCDEDMLSLDVLDNNVLKILNYTSNKDSKILKL